MSTPDLLMPEQIAEIRERRPGVRASLACEGMFLSPEKEALFEEFDREMPTSDQRRDRLLAYSRARRKVNAAAAE